MPEQIADIWREVLRVAVTSCNPPVVGTNFRSAVNTAAAKHDLRFPPSDEPALRFIQLLERYPGVVSILRRPGQDFLVAPADSPDLLSKRLKDGLFGIRHDLFQAFTIIAENKPYYDKASDRVLWHDSGGNQSPDLVPIEPATSASEIQLRQDFADKQEKPTLPLLIKALEGPLPLQAFGRTIKECSLQIQWHSFRTERVLEKIQRWASNNKLDWKDAWLTPGRRTAERDRERHLPISLLGAPDGGRRTEGDPLHLLFSGLDAADIQRISIPLDLVLKVLSARKRL